MTTRKPWESAMPEDYVSPEIERAVERWLDANLDRVIAERPPRERASGPAAPAPSRRWERWQIIANIVGHAPGIRNDMVMGRGVLCPPIHLETLILEALGVGAIHEHPAVGPWGRVHYYPGRCSPGCPPAGIGEMHVAELRILDFVDAVGSATRGAIEEAVHVGEVGTVPPHIADLAVEYLTGLSCCLTLDVPSRRYYLNDKGKSYAAELSRVPPRSWGLRE